MPVTWKGAPLWDVEGVHDVLREWRTIADSYPGDRYYIGEVVVNGAERLARYMRPDELHTTFNLDFLKSPLESERLHRTIDDTLAAFSSVGAPATWTLSNHDETRHVTRYGRAWTGVPLPPPWPFPETDLALGTRRARAMLLLLLALPGSVFLYQGERLGLWEVEDLHDEHSRTRSGRARAHGSAAGTAAGCRSPGPATNRRSVSPTGHAVAAAARGAGGTTPPRRRSSAGLDAGLLPRGPGHPAQARRRPGSDADLAGWPGRRAGLLPRQLQLHGQPLRRAGAGGRTVCC